MQAPASECLAASAPPRSRNATACASSIVPPMRRDGPLVPWATRAASLPAPLETELRATEERPELQPLGRQGFGAALFAVDHDDRILHHRARAPQRLRRLDD